MNIKKNILFILFLIFSILLCSCSNKIKNFSKEEEHNKFSCTYENKKRYFYLYTPDSTSFENTKLVVMLHGYGNSGRSFSRDTQFEKDALPLNYAVLYINGIPNSSVKMSGPGWNYNYDNFGKTDMNFIIDLIQFIQKEYGLNKETYIIGFSNGAFMTTKLAVEKPEYFKAFVSVGGMMPETVWNHKKNKNSSVKFFQINGTKDDVTPMKLNDSCKYNPNPAMEDVIEYFVKTNGITTEPVLETINNKITINKYQDKVWWMLINDYPHSWPSQRFCEVNINKIILDFFEN